jgi:hypothetical protein
MAGFEVATHGRFSVAAEDLHKEEYVELNIFLYGAHLAYTVNC